MKRRSFLSMMLGAAGAGVVAWRLPEPRIFLPPRMTEPLYLVSWGPQTNRLYQDLNGLMKRWGRLPDEYGIGPSRWASIANEMAPVLIQGHEAAMRGVRSFKLMGVDIVIDPDDHIHAATWNL